MLTLLLAFLLSSSSSTEDVPASSTEDVPGTTMTCEQARDVVPQLLTMVTPSFDPQYGEFLREMAYIGQQCGYKFNGLDFLIERYT